MPLKDNYQPGDLFGHADLNAMAGQVNSLADAALKQYRVNDYGADPTGAALSDSAVSAARAAMGTAPGLLVFGVGTYKLSDGLNVANGTHLGVLQGVRGQGAGLTQIKYLGTGACLEFRQSSAIDNPLPSGGCRGINIWGWDNTNNDVYGLRYGDIFRMVVDDVMIEGFGYSGGIGLYADNQIGWSERAWINVAVTQCTECIVFEAKTGPSLMAWGSCSFDYSNYYLSVICQPNQHGVVIRSGLTAGAQCEFVGVTMNIVANCIGATEGNSNSGILFRVGKDDNDVVEFGGALNIFGETSGGPVGHYDIQIGASKYYALARVHSTGIINFMPGNWFRAGNASNNAMSHGGRITNSPSLGHMGRHSGAGTNTTQMSAQADWRLDDDTFTLFGERGNIFTLTPDAGDYGIVLDIGGMGEGRPDRFGVQAIDVWIRQPWTGGSVTISDWFPQPWVGDPPEDPDAGWHFRWSDNVAPTLSTTAGDWDLIRISSYNVFRWTAEHITRRRGVTSIDGASGAVTGLVTLTGTQTLTNKTLTSPRVNQILDTNGATGLFINATANAVNYPKIWNDSTAWVAYGTDGSATDINLQVLSKGAGSVNIYNGGIYNTRFYKGSGTPVNYVQVTSASTGNAPKINAGGTDANVNLNLAGQGTGVVQANGVPVVTTTEAQSVTNKTLDTTNTSTKFISRSVATVTAPTALGSTAATDYVTFADMRRTVALLHCEGSDGSTSVVDSSNLAAGWTCAGNAQLDTAQYKFGSSSLLFDGTGDYVTPTAAAENFAFGTNDFTIEMWVRPSTITGASRILYDSRPASTDGAYHTLYITAPSGVLIYHAAGATRITGPALSLDTWYHVAVSRSSGTTRMFVGGVQYGGNYTDGNSYLASASRPRIGGNSHSSDTSNFIGHMDEINIVNGLAKYTSNFTPPTGPLDNITEDVSTASSTVALLHCDGANASTVVSDSGVLLSNWTAVGNAQISTAQSKFGGSSIYFDGTGDYVTATANSSNFAFGTGDFTIELWLRPESVAAASTIFDLRPPSVNGAYPLLFFEAGGGLVYLTSSTYRITGGSLSAGAWHHVALCRSGTSTKLFVGGTQVGSTWTDTTNYLADVVRFGANYNPSNFIQGHMDEIRISRYARYTTAFTPPTAPHPDPPAIKLPTAVGNTNRNTVKCTGPQTVLLSSGNGQLIDGAATVAIPQGDSKDVVSDSTKWFVV